MPTYEYECRSCSHSFEAFQSMAEDPLSSCPECGGPVRRLIGGGTGIIFKGSGFYVNDSRKSSSGSVPASTPSSKTGDSAQKGGDAASTKTSEAASTASSSPAAPSKESPARPTAPSTAAPAV
ncbi:MAG TPA: FmdB family zinc ribbon protein [Rectinemataceae bacterium]|nr:FmdB family zinc ribbon protein [Rectinemataceae bacterium]